MSLPGIIFLGDASWQPLGNPEPSDPPNDLPTTREQWIGRADLTSSFRTTYRVGAGHLGGYIIDNTPRSNQPFYGLDTIDLIVARQPDFNAFVLEPTMSLKTATKSANVSGTGIIPPALIPPGSTAPNPLPCTRTVNFYSPEAKYTYFSSLRPDAPRFSSIGSSRQPIVVRSVITVQLSSGILVFSGNAPAPIVTALFMPVTDSLTGTEAQLIRGTPWYHCTDTLSRVLRGDE